MLIIAITDQITEAIIYGFEQEYHVSSPLAMEIPYSCLYEAIYMNYCQVSNISRTLVGN